MYDVIDNIPAKHHHNLTLVSTYPSDLLIARLKIDEDTDFIFHTMDGFLTEKNMVGMSTASSAHQGTSSCINTILMCSRGTNNKKMKVPAALNPSKSSCDNVAIP